MVIDKKIHEGVVLVKQVIISEHALQRFKERFGNDLDEEQMKQLSEKLNSFPDDFIGKHGRVVVKGISWIVSEYREYYSIVTVFEEEWRIEKAEKYKRKKQLNRQKAFEKDFAIDYS